MKEPYGEGQASHTGSESSVRSCKAKGEALTGAQAGGVFSREMLLNQRADAVHDGGRQVGAKSRAFIGLCEVRDPRMQGNSTRENREALPTPRHEAVDGPAGEGDEPEVQHARW
jgi:hypothetical protein